MTQEDKRLKEIEHLIWLKNEIKEIKALREEKMSIEGEKRLIRKQQAYKRKK